MSTPMRVLTCTVTANRLFTGYRMGQHPVRQAHELINVLTNGTIRLGPERSPVRFWRSESFQTDDLVDYLAGNSVVGLQHEAMLPVTRAIEINGRQLQLRQFYLSLEQAALSIARTMSPIDKEQSSP